MAIAANLSVALSLNSARYRRGLDRARAQSRTFADRTRRNIRGVTNTFGRLQTAIVAIGSVLAGSAVVRAAARYEDLQTSLASVTGSAESGQRAFQFIQQFATETQFSVEQLSTAFIQLRAAGIEPTRELLTLFTDTAAVTTDQIGSLQAITALYARTTSGGLGLEELNRLADRGIPVFRILEEQLGLTRLEISSFGRTTEGAQRILGALEVGLNDLFGGATQNRVRNLSTQISNTGIALTNLASTIGETLRPAIEGTLNLVQNLAGAFQALLMNEEAIERVGQAFRVLLAGVGGFIAARTANGIIRIINLIRLLRAATVGAGIAQAVLTALSASWIGILVGAIGAGAIFIFFDEISASIQGLVTDFNNLLEAQIETLGPTSPLGGETQTGTSSIATSVERVSQSVDVLSSSLMNSANLAMNFGNTATSALSSFSQEIGRAVVTGMANFQQLFQSILIQIAAVVTQALIATAILTALGLPVGGGGGGFIGSILGFQSGGRPRAGRPAIVGESGPELIVPDGNSTVVPNGQFDQQPNIGNVTIQVGPGASPAAVRDTISRGFIDQFNNGAIDAGGRPVFRTRRPV